jgi:hypothetical protein
MNHARQQHLGQMGGQNENACNYANKMELKCQSALISLKLKISYVP